MGKEIVNQVQKAQRAPGKINLEEEHTKTHSNQTDNNQRQSKNKGKTTGNIPGNTHQTSS